MYTDHLIKKWNFEQVDLLDMREVLYQEAVENCEKLKKEVETLKVDVEFWKDICGKYFKTCEEWSETYEMVSASRNYWESLYKNQVTCN